MNPPLTGSFSEASNVAHRVLLPATQDWKPSSYVCACASESQIQAPYSDAGYKTRGWEIHEVSI